MYEGDINPLVKIFLTQSAEKRRRGTLSCLKLWLLKNFGKLQGVSQFYPQKITLTVPKKLRRGNRLVFRKIFPFPEKRCTEIIIEEWVDTKNSGSIRSWEKRLTRKKVAVIVWNFFF